MVNGKSTLYEEEGDPSHLLAWVIDPGPGVRDLQASRWITTRASRSACSRTRKPRQSPTVPNTGLIHFHIFRSGGGSGTKDIAGGDTGTKDDSSSQAMNISLRGLTAPARDRARPARSRISRRRSRTHAHAGSRHPKLDRRRQCRRRRDPERRGRRTRSWSRRLSSVTTSQAVNNNRARPPRDRAAEFTHQCPIAVAGRSFLHPVIDEPHHADYKRSAPASTLEMDRLGTGTDLWASELATAAGAVPSSRAAQAPRAARDRHPERPGREREGGRRKRRSSPQRSPAEGPGRHPGAHRQGCERQCDPVVLSRPQRRPQ